MTTIKNLINKFYNKYAKKRLIKYYFVYMSDFKDQAIDLEDLEQIIKIAIWQLISRKKNIFQNPALINRIIKHKLIDVKDGVDQGFKKTCPECRGTGHSNNTLILRKLKPEDFHRNANPLCKAGKCFLCKSCFGRGKVKRVHFVSIDDENAHLNLVTKNMSLSEEVWEIIKTMTTDFQYDVLYLRYVEEKSFANIGKTFDLPKQAVEQAHSRGLKRIRKKFKKSRLTNFAFLRQYR